MQNMTEKSFRKASTTAAMCIFATATLTYLLTIEPTASFWDCGEFIASSYRLEVGHPPGNPVFQILARAFSMFADGSYIAMAVNALSAICSSLTILLLYLTIVFFAKRLVKGDWRKDIPTASAVAVIGSGAVGSLAYCFSDTFWFSAVEAEVYSMSSLFTALVFYCMIKWYEQADSPYADRWIVMIAFLMGLSIGVHLLNLLAIPAIVFLYYYRKRENGRYSIKELIKISAISVLILAAVLFGVIPCLPKAAAYTDLFFVNVLGLPFNSGAAFFMTALLAACFRGLFRTMKKGKAFANTVLLCLTVTIIGFSVFSIVIIRSSVMPPTNENRPDNPFSLIRYLSREQYGSNPLIYGEYFGAPYELEESTYWTRLGDRYEKVQDIPDIKYRSEGKMLFPRMWDSRKEEYKEFYRAYIGKNGRKVSGTDELKPTFLQNLTFFFDYQMNWMYWRYFFWNFAGRQNDIHSPTPGDLFKGNWESGIGFLDSLRLGDQSDAPGYLRDNKGKNHYYMLPLLLGLIGLFFQYSRDKRGCWLIFLMFFMTGIAIVVYLNQSPYQVRERDYAYAGSFCFFSVWIGLAVAAVYSWIMEWLDRNSRRHSERSRGISVTVIVSVMTASMLGVPALMACENWDDHDRSNRYTAVEMARNYLNSVGRNGILVTHGDNDTFPLWYAQEVEGVRTDVRIINTSLYEADWHIEQMRFAANESAPMPMKVKPEQYLQGTNDIVLIYDTRDSIFPLANVMEVFRHPQAKIPLTDGSMADYIASRRFSIPVNKENVIRHGILDPKYIDMIPDEIVLEIPKDKRHVTKGELFMLDLLSNYEWDRPISLLSAGGDINIGIRDYLMFDGFSYRFIPIKNVTDRHRTGFCDADDLYRKMTGIYEFESLKRTDWFVDYNNLYTFVGSLSQRDIFARSAMEMTKAGMLEKAVVLLDMCCKCIPEENFPLEMTGLMLGGEEDVMAMIEAYHFAGAAEKALELAEKLADGLLESTAFFIRFYGDDPDMFEACYHYLSILSTLADEMGEVGFADSIRDRFNALLE